MTKDFYKKSKEKHGTKPQESQNCTNKLKTYFYAYYLWELLLSYFIVGDSSRYWIINLKMLISISIYIYILSKCIMNILSTCIIYTF